MSDSAVRECERAAVECPSAGNVLALGLAVKRSGLLAGSPRLARKIGDLAWVAFCHAEGKPSKPNEFWPMGVAWYGVLYSPLVALAEECYRASGDAGWQG